MLIYGEKGSNIRYRKDLTVIRLFTWSFRLKHLALKIFLPDSFYGHLHTGPVLECFCTLMKQHVHPVEGGAGSLLAGDFSQQGFPRVVNDVSHSELRVKPGGVRDERSVCLGRHAYGGGVRSELHFLSGFF